MVIDIPVSNGYYCDLQLGRAINDEDVERIRDIRASEKRFYQKLRDLFALSSDYDKTDRETKQFFSETQNKLIYGVTGKTAADLIMAELNHWPMALAKADLNFKNHGKEI